MDLFIYFYSKQFLRLLSTDILETLPYDVALAPIENLRAEFLKVSLQ